MKQIHREALRFLIASVIIAGAWAIAPLETSCSSAAWQKYENSVASRSVQAYGKDSGDSQQVGVGYTVRYK